MVTLYHCAAYLEALLALLLPVLPKLFCSRKTKSHRLLGDPAGAQVIVESASLNESLPA